MELRSISRAARRMGGFSAHADSVSVFASLSLRGSPIPDTQISVANQEDEQLMLVVDPYGIHGRVDADR